jgi:hypothetical protein
MSRSDDLSVFIERPNDIKRLIDFMIYPAQPLTHDPRIKAAIIVDRLPCCLLLTAFKGSKCRSNSGRPSLAATA